MFKNSKRTTKRIYSGRADRCTGDPGNSGSTADPGIDRLH